MSKIVGATTGGISLHRLRPFALALVLIAGIELLIRGFGTDGRYNTDFFDFSPVQRDVLSKHVLYEKFSRVLPQIPSQTVQVGDSSGFYGVVPAEVSSASGGEDYINLSCCGDTGWNGYYYGARLALQREDRPRTLVLHITPFWAPASATFQGDNALAVLMRDYILKDDVWHRLRPPSAGYRLRLTNLVYHGQWLDDFPYDLHTAQPHYPSLRGWREQFRETRGWVPLPWAMDDALLAAPQPLPCQIENAYSESRYLGLVREDSLYIHLQRFARLARDHDARLVLVTNPVPCVPQQDASSADIARQLARFRADYPDVAVPFAFLRQWPQSAFKDRWHLGTEGAIRHSRLIGDFLHALPRLARK